MRGEGRLYRKEVKSPADQEAEQEAPVEDSRIEQRPISVVMLDRENLTEESLKALRELEKSGEYLEEPSGEGYEYNATSIDDRPKTSKKHLGCTGLVLIGKAKDFDRQLSFLAHNFFPTIMNSPGGIQRPSATDESGEKLSRRGLIGKYEEVFDTQLEQFVNLVDRGTVGVGLFGGEAYGNKRVFKSSTWREYEGAMAYQAQVIKRKLGISPSILAGPQERTRHPLKGTDVYIDTQNRRVYIVRQRQTNPARDESYRPENLSDQKKKW